MSVEPGITIVAVATRKVELTAMNVEPRDERGSRTTTIVGPATMMVILEHGPRRAPGIDSLPLPTLRITRSDS